MAIDSEHSISLPNPPPPRPAARRAAIDMAMRKFDGVEAPISARPPIKRFQWSSLNRRPAGALAAAAIIAVVGIPAIQIALRDNQPGVATESGRTSPPAESPAAPESVAAKEPAPVPTADESAAAVEETLSPATTAEPSQRSNLVAAERKAAPALPSIDTPSPMAVIAAPAPPPPPPPPAPVAERQAQAAEADNIVVTGSRISSPGLNSNGFAQRAEAPPTQREIIAPFGAFLNRLQESLAANDRRAILRLVGLPLRVNFAGGARTYRTRQDIERDYDRIFTPAVLQAAENLYASDLAVRDGARLRGSTRIWFGCGLRTCSDESVIRVREVTP